MQRWVLSWVVVQWLGCLVLGSVSGGEPWIGFTRLRTNLEGGRHANVRTSRAMLVRANGTELREFGAAWVDSDNTWTQFAGWSPDGRHLVFVSGQHYDCHPFVVRADGTGLRQLSDRGGYRGVIEFLDVADFHGGSSDVPMWARDGQSIFHTRRYGEAVELVRVDLSGELQRLTMSAAGVQHYHPQPSPDGTRLVYGSLRDGVRQLYVMDLGTGQERQITDLQPGEGALWAHWRPVAGE